LELVKENNWMKPSPGTQAFPNLPNLTPRCPYCGP